jgi:uncharacterized protein
MKLPDVNVLLYAINSAAPQHRAAHDALRQAYESGPVGMCWSVLLGVLRLSTRSGIFAVPLSIEQGLEVMQRWIEHPGTVLVAPGERHAAILSRLLLGAGQGGNLVTDAHLAALAIEHAAELLTFDRDFARFAGLHWSVPA